MIDFTYTVFLTVASLCGFLVTVFAAGIIGVLLFNAHQAVEPAEPVERAELPRAA